MFSKLLILFIHSLYGLDVTRTPIVIAGEKNPEYFALNYSPFLLSHAHAIRTAKPVGLEEFAKVLVSRLLITSPLFLHSELERDAAEHGPDENGKPTRRSQAEQTFQCLAWPCCFEPYLFLLICH